MKSKKILKWLGFGGVFFAILICILVMLVSLLLFSNSDTDCGTSTSDSSFTDSADTTKNAQMMYEYMVSNAHATPEGAAGALGVWEFESKFQPKVANGAGSGATGLAQWMGSRLSNLRNWCQSNGKDPDTLNGQIAFAMYEMKQSYPKSYRTLTTSNDVDEVVEVITKDYEGLSQDSSQWLFNKRKPMAKNWLGKFGSDAVSGTAISEGSEDAIGESGSSCDDMGAGGDWAPPMKGKGSITGEQNFGYSESRSGHFHDGEDYGSSSFTDPHIYASHGGKVIFAGDPGTVGMDNSFPNGLGKSFVVTKSDDGYYVVYQEFSTSTDGIKVHEGDTVTTGQLIGIRNTDHLHMGITKMDWKQAEGHAFKDDGTWIDPKKLIKASAA
ncbi:phage tail tip lysozyme [Fructilactobacillus cliffordii]|uniref:Phage tail tip lysozyme n=1 Tax=Fructilactobacillus cliffordii TaxID=2940299 RepID=A0A9Q9E3Y2_9LACO|nr:phage tail tip lysozyme [Fructilactobacillus cliffordii]USS89993.1 phage tail tip lysozyme [Fructilactobacillus cliffordii]